MKLSDVLVEQSNGRLLQQGWSPRCDPYPAPDDQHWGVLKTTAVQPGWFDDTQHKSLPAKLDPRPAFEIKAGDLLITSAGPRSRCGVPALVRRTRPRLMMSGKFYRFRTTEEVVPEFLEMYLLAPGTQDRIDAMKTGINDSGLNLTHDRFLELLVPVPPLDEQRRIVAILEDHLSRLADATASLAAASRRAELLLSSALGELDQPSDPRVTLGNLAEIGTGSTPSRSDSSNYDGGVIPWVTSGDISQARILAIPQAVTVKGQSVGRLKMYPAETLVVAMYGEGKTRGTVGRLGVAATMNQACAAVQVRDPDQLDWIEAVLRSNYLAMRRMAAGGVQPNLNLSLVRSIPIPLPAPAERAARLERVGRVTEAVARLRESVSASERRGGALRRSLLAAGFRGDLAAW